MSLPVARVRARPWRKRLLSVDGAIVLLCVAAMAAGFLPMVDAEEMYLCGCAETRRLNDLYGGAPAGLLGLVTAARIVTGHRGGQIRFALQAMAVFTIMLVSILLAGQEGPGHVAGLATHLPLVVMGIARWIFDAVERSRS